MHAVSRFEIPSVVCENGWKVEESEAQSSPARKPRPTRKRATVALDHEDRNGSSANNSDVEVVSALDKGMSEISSAFEVFVIAICVHSLYREGQSSCIRSCN